MKIIKKKISFLIMATLLIALMCNKLHAEISADVLTRLNSVNVEDRLDACIVLGQIGNEEAIPYLEPRLRDKSMLIRHSAANTLAKIGGDKAKDIFQKMVTQGGVEAKRVGLAGLAMTGDPESMQLVVKQLDNQNWQVRWSAVYALGERGYEPALKKVSEIVKNDPYKDSNSGDYPVRVQAEIAVQKINCFIEWYDNLEDAWLLTEELQKPILIYWTVAGDRWCRQLEEDVFFSPGTADICQQFICLKVEVTDNSVLVTQYDINGAPSITVIDQEGQEIERILGLVSQKELTSRLEKVIKGKGTPKQWQKAVKDDPGDVVSYWYLAEWYLDNGRVGKAVPLLRNIIKYDNKNQSGYTDNAMFVLGYCLGGQGKYQPAIELLECLIKDYPHFKDIDKAMYCLGLDYLGIGQTEKAKKEFAEIMAGYPDSKVIGAVNKIMVKIGD